MPTEIIRVRGCSESAARQIAAAIRETGTKTVVVVVQEEKKQEHYDPETHGYDDPMWGSV